MLSIRLWNARGNKNGAGVDSDGNVCVINSPHPPLAEQKTRPFRQYLTTDGTASGSNDMGVDGTTPVDFYCAADDDEDIYITTLSVIMGYAASGQPHQFADGTALTNGVRMYYTSRQGEQDIDDAIKSNTEFLRLGNDSYVSNNWEVRHVGATNDYGYFTSIDLRQFSAGLGVKLDKGTTQKFVMTVRDNLSLTPTTFNVQVYGFKRFE